MLAKNHNVDSPPPNEETISTKPIEINEQDLPSLLDLSCGHATQILSRVFGIRLYLPATPEPIEIRNKPNISLGWSDEAQKIFPTLDLSCHHAPKLGVSRLHAKIIFKDDGFYITDIGSKNGTWVNEKRIEIGQYEPITQHDTLRLARLMIVVGACQFT